MKTDKFVDSVMKYDKMLMHVHINVQKDTISQTLDLDVV